MRIRMKRIAGRKARKRQKVGPGLVTLGSSVILAAYGAGWVQTRAFRVDSHLAAEPSPFAEVLAPAGSPTSRVIVQPDRPDAPAAASTAMRPLATPDIAYREGRYVGSGESIHGGVTVEIVIFEGRVASAAIVKCDTRYACSDLDALSEQLVERQSARLRYVSGATDSSRAYVKAVEAALAKAAM